MPFPFLFLVVSLAVGILLSFLFSFSLQLSLLFLIVALVSAWFFFLGRKSKLSFLLILVSALFLGSALHTLHQNNYEKNSLRSLDYSEYADFYGRLYKSVSRGQHRDFLYLKVNKVVYQNQEKRIRGNLRVTIPRSSEFPRPLELFNQDKVKVSARLLSDKGYQNFKGFSLKNYLQRQKIHRRAFSKSPLLVRKIEGKSYSPLRLISILRRKLQEKIEHYFSIPVSGLISSQGTVLEALLLGERGRMDSSVKTSLQESGLFHLFAISGAHIAIISFLLFSILKLLRFPNRPSYILLMTFLLFYAILVEGRPSVLRATIMSLAFLLGKLFWKDVNLLNTISISAFFLLLLSPFSLFDLGFQLTFAATLSIILFFPRVMKFLPKLPLRISEILAISFTAQLGVIPLIASSFNRVTFSSLVLNLVALPLIGIIMACGFVFLPLSFIFPHLAQHLSRGIDFLIALFLGLTHFLDRLSFISYRIPTPHLIIIIGYFAFLSFLLLPNKIRKQSHIFLGCFLIFFVLLITHPFPSLSKTLKLTFIDVGQGDSVLVEFPGSKKMLVDGGGLPGNRFDIGERVVSPFLWRKGIKKIHYLVLTHAHPDHLNGLRAVARNFRLGEAWEAFSPLEDRSYTDYKESLPSRVRQKRLFRGQLNRIGKVEIEVLHPERGELFVENVGNEQSLVLRIIYGQTSFLLAADIGRSSEGEILGNFKDLESLLLKSPHHGSNSSSSREFLEKVSPQIIVISVGADNWYRHPDQEVIIRYEKMGAKIFRTDVHGAVEVSSNGQKLFVRTAVNKTD
ncbi:MAG: DNA internalization-related competence protein ComEC/Rec2 [Candidatus Aminicenantes bacterium]|nr:DNA internalization-related competence protein ComEC/Rec2 [Candidatus Aminicenantes bacterium]